MTLIWTDEDILKFECEEDAAWAALQVRCFICDRTVEEYEAVPAGPHGEWAHEECAERRYPTTQGDI